MILCLKIGKLLIYFLFMISIGSCFDCRSVGTFARALDCSSSVKQPSLHMSAAAASRDITLVSLLVYTFCGLLQVYKLFLGNGFGCWRHNYYIMLSGFLENLHPS